MAKSKKKSKQKAAAAAAAAAVEANGGKSSNSNQTADKVAEKLAKKEARAISKVHRFKAFKEAKKAKKKSKVAQAKAKPEPIHEELNMTIIGGAGSSDARASDGPVAVSLALRRLQASLAQITGPVAGNEIQTVDVADMGSLFVVDTAPQAESIASDSRSSSVSNSSSKKKKKKKKKQKKKFNSNIDTETVASIVTPEEEEEEDDDDDEQPLKKMRSDPPVFEFSPFAMETDVFEESDKLNSVGSAIRDVIQRKANAAEALAAAALASDLSITPTKNTSAGVEAGDKQYANTTIKKRKRDESASAPDSAPARVLLSKGPLEQITMVSRASSSNNNSSARGVGSSSSQSAMSNSNGGPRRLDSAFDDEQARLRPPPWITPDDPIWRKCVNVPEIKLHNEIVRFTELVSPSKKEQTDRETMVKLISSVVNRVWPNARTEVFGSFSTDLCLPASDVDMVVFDCTPVKKAIYKLARELRDDPRVNIYRMQVIDKARVPIIKLELKDHKYQADICFDQDSGPATGKLIRSLIRTMPEVRSLTLLIKYFLAQRGLNETYMGGMGSYLCFLTVVSTVQHFRRRHRKAIAAHQEKQNNNKKKKNKNGDIDAAAAFEREWGSGLDLQHNLGRLLLEYFALYGKRLNFTTTAISLRDGGTYRPKTQDDLKEARNAEEVHRLCVENPRDAKADVGRSSHKIAVVRRAFRYAHDVLSIYVGVDGPRSQGLLAAGRPRPESILEQIIFVDETLATRDS